MANHKKLRVGLLWHSITSDNLGVGALTLGQMELITRAAQRQGRSVSFVVIGTRGGTPYPISEFEVEATAEYALRAFKTGDMSALTLLRTCDVVFDIGEGDSFSDIYGNKRLAIQVSGKVLCKLSGIPLILSPQTIGPFKSGLGKKLGALAMKVASRIYARDHLSRKLLDDSGFSHKSQEVIDVAFALPFQPAARGGERVKVGINVSGLLFNGGYSGKNEFGLTVDYRPLLEQMCAFLLAEGNVDVWLVGHVITQGLEDDYHAAELLREKFPALQLAPRFASPVEAKSFISGMDFFTGARMHACIAAFSSGVPVLPMAYSRKFNGLFNSIGYSHILDCLTMTTEEGMQLFRSSYAQRDVLAEDVRRGNELAQSRLDLYVNEVAALLPV